MFAVTTGHGVPELVARYEADHDDYQAILLKSLADRLAEAFAEYVHEHVRREVWGFEGQTRFSNTELIKEEYDGIRPAPGYPAQPDHTEKRTIWKVLGAEEATGITLTEHLAMAPAASVCGLIFAHSEAEYFNLGDVSKDQIQSYAKRKAMPVDEVERWMAPRLAYDPEKE